MSRFAPEVAEHNLSRVRTACLALPQTSERLSHGGPAFFIKGKTCFVMFVDDHHDDGHLAIWCAAPDGVQAEMVETEPERFFRPPYVGHRGWLGVELTEVSTAELAAICREAFLTVAPPTVRRLLDSGPDRATRRR
ncbi:MAG TPA: MmcQ/YjbR family DNA-binding protein [Propionibacteriaceae bacterium]|nr:MmcQ/YjbR family DNA-binding protein [Propionibacteriaceae bacterium]